MVIRPSPVGSTRGSATQSTPEPTRFCKLTRFLRVRTVPWGSGQSCCLLGATTQVRILVELFSLSFTNSNSSPAETEGFSRRAVRLLFDRQQRDAFENDRFEVAVDDSQLCVPDVEKVG